LAGAFEVFGKFARLLSELGLFSITMFDTGTAIGSTFEGALPEQAEA
jgi:hypothetical protein